MADKGKWTCSPITQILLKILYCIVVLRVNVFLFIEHAKLCDIIFKQIMNTCKNKRTKEILTTDYVVGTVCFIS